MDLNFVRSRCKVDGDCWIWQLSCNNCGTPMMAVNRSATPVRQVVWWLLGRERKKNYVFGKPHCDPKCVNPEHQRYITRKESALESNLSRGVRHSLITGPNSRARSSLTWEKVREIRARYAECGNAAQVAREFGLNHPNTHKICRNQSWKEPTPWNL